MRIDTIMLAVTLIGLSGLSQALSACNADSAGLAQHPVPVDAHLPLAAMWPLVGVNPARR